jgi:hypothetical protein
MRRETRKANLQNDLMDRSITPQDYQDMKGRGRERKSVSVSVSVRVFIRANSLPLCGTSSSRRA